MKKSVFICGLLALSAGCATLFQATPRLTKWHHNEMTLCCAWCNAADWQRSTSHHCHGQPRQIGGETVERITGYETHATRDGYTDRVESRPQVQQEECRVYACNGTVYPETLAD